MLARIVTLLVLIFSIAATPAMANPLFDRIIDPGELEERLPIDPLFASFREVIRGEQTRSDLETQFGLSTEEKAGLGDVIDEYNTCTTNQAKRDYMAAFQDIMRIAEHGTPDWYPSSASAWTRLQAECP